MSDNIGRLKHFIVEMRKLVDEADGDEATILERGKDHLAELVRHDDWLPEAFAQADPERYQQNLLYCDPLERFCVVSFVWGPGQETPVHDHTTWGLVGMLRGAELSQSFSLVDDKPVPGETERLEPGEVVMVSPVVGDIHRVQNAFDDRASISIHVYGGNIGTIERNVFPLEGGTKRFVSGYANAMLPNIWA
ncbi:MAG TPA: cysteine dioxygenase [Rhizobiaceae bacterium]|nr:cysteine dioxygenase [Rhizobiaceae bacterium]